MDFIWDEFPGGNIEHIAEHGLTVDEVEHAMRNAVGKETSDSSGLPIYFGYTPSLVFIGVVFEWVDQNTVYVVTAFEAPE